MRTTRSSLSCGGRRHDGRGRRRGGGSRRKLRDDVVLRAAHAESLYSIQLT